MRKGKNWGYTTELFSNATVSAYHLEIKKGGFCSQHRHLRKINMFYVVKGELEISVWQDKNTCDKTILREGQSTFIPFGVFHKFKGLTDVECIEMYEVKFSGEDIERRTQGGLEK